MLTLDDLEHFADGSMSHLFAPAAGRPDVEKVARLARIVACLNACRDVPTEELAEGALVAARFRLRTALRQQHRGHRPDPAALLAAVEAALADIGEPQDEDDGPAERLEVEAEIQSTAAKLADMESLDPDLLAALARGEFQILPSSELASLAEVVGKFGATTQVDVDLAIDRPGPAHFARVRLALEGGLWRWTAREGCCMSRNGQPAFFLPPEDAVVQSLLAGLALRNGRTALAWVEAA